jgi:putative alpha-1,2-mannosidase
VFDEVTIKLPANKRMVVRTKNNAKDHPYIQSVRLNGKPYGKVYIDHATLMKGGVLEFVMGDRPNKTWGITQDSWPSSVN